MVSVRREPIEQGKKAAIILAAGKGKRMKSDLPKVLHPIGGRPMVAILIDTLRSLDFRPIIVVVGHKGKEVISALAEYPLTFVWQREQLGTGHAVMMAREALAGFEGVTLVANGDVPFLSAGAIESLLAGHARTGAVATCLSAVFDDPTGYGRIIRDGNSDRLKAIVEEKDSCEDIRQIREINSGTFCFDNQALFDTIDQIDNDNTQSEYYLTDVVKILYAKGLRASVSVADDPDEVMGVNSPEQLQLLADKFLAG